MIKINDKLKKLNDYTESVNPQSQQVPAIIPDVKNAYFNHTDLAPKYTAGENVKIENGVISKTDTTYTGDNRIITVDEETKKISAKNASSNAYSPGDNNAIRFSENTSTRVTTMSLNNIALSGLPITQQKQPVYRVSNINNPAYTYTHFAGHSNKPLILIDPIWEEDNSKSTGFTRFFADRVVCTDLYGQISKTITISDLNQINQIAIHQHNLMNVYFDYQFFVNHYGKEIYISKTVTTDPKNKGCKFFILNNNTKKLKVFIYSCGMICVGRTTDTLKEVCLHDISFSEWINGVNGDTFNYVLKPFKMKMGYNGICIDIPAYNNTWYDINGDEAVPLNSYYMGQLYPTPTILEHYNFFTTSDPNSEINDPRYEFWDYNAKKISCYYYLKREYPTDPRLLPPPIYTGTLTRPDEFYPPSENEYFSSFKFIVAGIDISDPEYNILYLVDSRF